VDTDFENLIKLQELDIEMGRLSILLENIPLQIEEIDKNIEESLQIVQDAKSKLAQNQKVRRDLETEVQDNKEKTIKYKRQLNEVKTNKEYRSLLKEIDETNLRIDTLEEKIIEEMLQADEIEKEIKTANEKAAVAHQELSKKREIIFQEKSEAEDKMKKLEENREELVPKIPSDQLKLYNQISSKKNGIVLSEIHDEFCSMCHMRVRPQMVNELLAGSKIILCENCGRILYYSKKSS
jgi:predicted  nucleic acid-binding Zn-ribbon protein